MKDFIWDNSFGPADKNIISIKYYFPFVFYILYKP